MSVADLGSRTWPEVDAHGRGLVLAVPLGACEQHGPHLPLQTDTLIAVAIAEAAAAERRDVVIAPALPYGASGEHAGFPGTLSAGTEVLAAYVTELVRSARSWSRAVVVVSGHGGNADALERVARSAEDDGDVVVIFFPSVAGGDAHAGRTETSLVLALREGLVRHNEAVIGNLAPLPELASRLRAEGVASASASGVLGDPTGATAAEGRALLGAIAADLFAAVDGALGDGP